jgi:hypothetical protein
MDDSAIRDVLDSIREDIEQRQREYEWERFAETLGEATANMRKLQQAAIEYEQSVFKAKLRSLDQGHYYEWLKDADVSELDRQDAERALAFCLQDLGLGGASLKIVWYRAIAPEQQQAARERFLSGDLSLFPAEAVTRGFISWTSVLDHGHVNILANHQGRGIIRTIGHELKHVSQRLEQGAIVPVDATLDAIEADARAYGDRVYDRLVWGIAL